MKKRDLITVAILLIVTFGFYFIYWTIKTKNELKELGAKIPTTFLIIIPFVNFYFWYKYCVAYTKYVKNSNEYLSYFLLTSLLPLIAIFIMQNEINNLSNAN